jgi:ABC-type dipeptide/oligopeptide/nickel transport system permease subunit
MVLIIPILGLRLGKLVLGVDVLGPDVEGDTLGVTLGFAVGVLVGAKVGAALIGAVVGVGVGIIVGISVETVTTFLIRLPPSSVIYKLPALSKRL